MAQSAFRDYMTMFVVIAVILVLFVIVVRALPGPSAPSASATFIADCQRLLSRQLRSPSQAQYGSIHDVAASFSFARTLDKDGYVSDSHRTIWLATVDAPNAFGTMVRSYAVCYRLSADVSSTAVLTSDISDIDFLVD